MSKVNSSILQRVIGAVRLDHDAYRDIDAGPGARIPAITIVVVAGLANGAGIAWTNEPGLSAVLLAVVGNLVAWAVFSGVAFAAAQSVLPGEATLAESTFSGVFRVVGFAQAPNVLGITLAIGALGLLTSFIGLIWMFACSIVGISVALRVSTSRAVAISVIAGFVTLTIVTVLISIWTALFF